MSKHAFARSFKELIVYQKGREATKTIFHLTKKFPREEIYSLTNQIRRSVRSIGAQIAEAWAKRRYPNHFTSKLTDADGEQNETQHWLTCALDCEYITQDTYDELFGIMEEIGKMIQGMIDRADDFAGHSSNRVKEPSEPYGSIDEFFTDPKQSN